MFSKAFYLDIPVFFAKPFRLAMGGVCLFFIGVMFEDKSPDVFNLLATTAFILTGTGVAWGVYSISKNE